VAGASAAGAVAGDDTGEVGAVGEEAAGRVAAALVEGLLVGLVLVEALGEVVGVVEAAVVVGAVGFACAGCVAGF
jgi:hypothetical protein